MFDLHSMKIAQNDFFRFYHKYKKKVTSVLSMIKNNFNRNILLKKAVIQNVIELNDNISVESVFFYFKFKFFR